MKRQSAQQIEPNSIQCVWSKAEIKALKAAVKEYKEDNWESVAFYLKKFSHESSPSKTPDECCEQWKSQSNEKSEANPLTNSEIQQFFEAHKELGNRWSQIATRIPGRTDNTVKNWFLCKLRKLSRSIKKKTVEVPEDSEELLHDLYMLDYLYKFYLSNERCENIKKALNSQIKKRKNDGDRYINKMLEKGDVTIEKLSVFVRLLLDKVRFKVDKTIIQEYGYLKSLTLVRSDSESNFTNLAANNDVKTETVVSIPSKFSFLLIDEIAKTQRNIRMELPLPDLISLNNLEFEDDGFKPIFNFSAYCMDYF